MALKSEDISGGKISYTQKDPAYTELTLPKPMIFGNENITKLYVRKALFLFSGKT